MAAPMSSRSLRNLFSNTGLTYATGLYRCFSRTAKDIAVNQQKKYKLKLATCAGAGLLAYLSFKGYDNAKIVVDAVKAQLPRPVVNAAAKFDSQSYPGIKAGCLPWHVENPVTRQVRFGPVKEGDLKITLYQYVTCPFCCKVRAYLNYNRINHDIVEVDSISRKQKKWTEYGKVPIVVCDGFGKNGYLQLNDSSVIISLLQSYQVTGKESSMEKFMLYYPAIAYKEGRKTKYDFPNKYFIMFEDQKPDRSMAELREEREWRAWVDDNLVHTLSPNAYRTLSEAVESFRWFDEVGDWKSCMSSWSRLTCIYSGAVVMWAIGGRLKRRYGLDNDVRQSLYQSINDWLDGIGRSRQFMGGDKPNLADLAVYGVMCSIEGCQAFSDLCQNTKFLKWYKPMKALVEGNK